MLSSSSTLDGDGEDSAASFIMTANDWSAAWPEVTSWPGAEEKLSEGSLDDASAILVESDGTVSNAEFSTSHRVISRLEAEKERLQTRVIVLEALAYSAAEAAQHGRSASLAANLEATHRCRPARLLEAAL